MTDPEPTHQQKSGDSARLASQQKMEAVIARLLKYKFIIWHEEALKLYVRRREREALETQADCRTEISDMTEWDRQDSNNDRVKKLNAKIKAAEAEGARHKYFADGLDEIANALYQCAVAMGKTARPQIRRPDSGQSWGRWE